MIFFLSVSIYREAGTPGVAAGALFYSLLLLLLSRPALINIQGFRRII